MIVTVNGKEETISDEITVTKLLNGLGYVSDFVAVAINCQCVPRSQFTEVIIKENDQIEVLAPMAGG